MHIEFRHLRTIKAIHDTGSVAGAADFLHITQSALSHQIKGIEDQAGVELFVRRSKPLRLSSAGLRMLAAAERILPEVDALEAEFDALRSGSLGRLYIGVENAAFYDWLLPVLERFRKVWPQLELDLRLSSSDPLADLRREDIDIVLMSSRADSPEVAFVPIFDFEMMILSADDRKSTNESFCEISDFAGENLLTYPSFGPVLGGLVDSAARDGVKFASRRQIEVTEMLLILAAAGQGVAAVPDWTLPRIPAYRGLTAQRVTCDGVTQRVYAAVRQSEVTTPYVAHLIRLARQEALRLQNR